MEDKRFDEGDLVRYFEFEQYHYGEGVLRNTGVGIVIKAIKVTWDERIDEWIETSAWKKKAVLRYRVVCMNSGLTKSFSGRTLELIAKGYNKED